MYNIYIYNFRADIIIATPEKWDGITRGWEKREYVQLVELLIIDEIHLLGVDRGPVLEVIVSRMRYISSQTRNSIRFVGILPVILWENQHSFKK